MRIVGLGDFHMHAEEHEISLMAMDDVERCAPDLLIPLGDFGTLEHIGTPKGLQEARAMLERVQVPWRPILGNHDLQNESGSGELAHGTMHRAYQDVFGVETPYGVVEYEDFRLLFISTEPQPAESCYQVQECYASERQFRTIMSALKQRRGVPILVFSHAPPLGSGLKTVPHTHVRATNAYLDQNHDPERWLKVIQQFPEIVMWFSAHYHLSHHHERAHTYRYGTHFFHTGVHGTCTRDGLRQSRVIDIERGCVSVKTLDHKKRSLTTQGSWQPDVPLLGLVQRQVFRKCSASIIGDAMLRPNSLWSRGDGVYVVESEDDYCWEVQPECEAVWGALHFGSKLQSAAVTAEGVWMASEHGVAYSRWDDLNRFVRTKNGGNPKSLLTLTHSFDCMTPGANGGIWATCGRDLYRIHTLASDSAQIRMMKVMALPEPAIKLMSYEDHCHILSSSGKLYAWDGRDLRDAVPWTPVLDWNTFRDWYASVYADGTQLKFVYGATDGGVWHEAAIDCGMKESWGPHDVQVLCFPNRIAIVRIGEALYGWQGEDRPIQRLYMQTDSIAAISRVNSDRDSTAGLVCFAFTTRGGTSESPKIEIWERSS